MMKFGATNICERDIDEEQSEVCGIGWM